MQHVRVDTYNSLPGPTNSLEGSDHLDSSRYWQFDGIAEWHSKFFFGSETTIHSGKRRSEPPADCALDATNRMVASSKLKIFGDSNPKPTAYCCFYTSRSAIFIKPTGGI